MATTCLLRGLNGPEASGPNGPEASGPNGPEASDARSNAGLTQRECRNPRYKPTVTYSLHGALPFLRR